MVVLALFGEMRQKAIVKAIEEKKDWPKQWLTDVHAAYAVLARHPLGDDNHVAVHYDFLKWLGAGGQAGARPRRRARALPGFGLPARPPAQPHRPGEGRRRPRAGVRAAGSRRRTRRASLEWFAGLASIRAAEYQRRTRQSDEALAPTTARSRTSRRAARRPIPTSAPRAGNADRARASAAARASRSSARTYEKTLDRAPGLDHPQRPAAFATPDGLNISPADTARMLSARLKEHKRDDLAAKLEAALAKLDPELLKLPAYERDGTASAPASRPRRRGQ